MIPVTPQPEPAAFDAKVRQKGLAYLQNKGIHLDRPTPPCVRLCDYWRACLDDLHSSYQGHCAYLAVYIERVTDGATVDHFVAKSRRPGLAYEWRNYRLACAVVNSRKRNHDDILDPFAIKDGWFRLELVTGRIYPNRELPSGRRLKIQRTIDRLKLDDHANRELRARHYQGYRQNDYSGVYLQRQSPFVWSEANRQKLL